MSQKGYIVFYYHHWFVVLGAKGVELNNLDKTLGKNLLIQTKLCMRTGRHCTHCSMTFFLLTEGYVYKWILLPSHTFVYKKKKVLQKVSALMVSTDMVGRASAFSHFLSATFLLAVGFKFGTSKKQ